MSVLYYLAWAIAIVLVVLGLWALLSPHALAREYGVPVEGHEPAGFVRATGIRDIAFGIVLAATAYLHLLWLLVVIAVVGVAVSIADLWVASHHGRAGFHRAHSIHASGIVAFVLVIAMALFAIGR
ncbi:MAG: DUF4267 domain-containing protein [Candidatus Eremiobacteraeota bacterium]|nr:DUF4267 domain-containing protein [Candidatus Eremiobacteraeota bacterium]MBV8499308.1 DUF4267 domain-containing protein [Candidatus Eremiobacteraeota bacterium]